MIVVRRTFSIIRGLIVLSAIAGTAAIVERLWAAAAARFRLA